MESLIYFIMSNGTVVITVLLASIILCVFSLLLMSFHSPQQAVTNEVGHIDRIEGVLKRILSDSEWHARPPAEASPQDDLLAKQIEILEEEVKAKQIEIERLESSGGTPPAEGGGEVSAEMQAKLRDLQERLSEYAVIEEDIADLSKFREENAELKRRLAEMTGLDEEESVTMPWDEFAEVIRKKKDGSSASAKEEIGE